MSGAASPLSRLRQVCTGLASLSDRARQRPLDWVRWTIPQQRWLQSNHRRKLLRTGNQFGKTWVGMAEAHYHCVGAHPFYDVLRPPVEVMVICATWSQSVKIQKKFNALVDRSAIDWKETPKFDEKNGFGAKNPTVQYLNGSVLQFKTTKQGGIEIAGATLHYVHIDEPTTRRVYTECDRRLMKTGGQMGLTFTPVNGPVDWTRALVDRGIIEDHHFRLEPEYFVPQALPGEQQLEPLRTEEGVLMDEAWCRAQREQTDLEEAPVVLDGEWETREGARRLPHFRDVEAPHGCLIVADPVDYDELRVGIDYGTGVNKQTAYVLLIRGKTVFVLREWVSPRENPTFEQIARAVLRMLNEVGVDGQLYGVDRMFGDVNTVGLSNEGSGRQYNRLLEEAFAKVLGLETCPIRIEEPDKGRGSVKAGEGAMNHAMAEKRFFVHASCVEWRRAALRYTGKEELHKDKIDPVRYACYDVVKAGVPDVEVRAHV